MLWVKELLKEVLGGFKLKYSTKKVEKNTTKTNTIIKHNSNSTFNYYTINRYSIF